MEAKRHGRDAFFALFLTFPHPQPLVDITHNVNTSYDDVFPLRTQKHSLQNKSVDLIFNSEASSCIQYERECLSGLYNTFFSVELEI